MIACNIKAYLTIFHEMNFLFSLDNLILLKWQMHFSVASDMELEGIFQGFCILKISKYYKYWIICNLVWWHCENMDIKFSAKSAKYNFVFFSKYFYLPATLVLRYELQDLWRYLQMWTVILDSSQLYEILPTGIKTHFKRPFCQQITSSNIHGDQKTIRRAQGKRQTLLLWQYLNTAMRRNNVGACGMYVSWGH